MQLITQQGQWNVKLFPGYNLTIDADLMQAMVY